CVGYVSKEEYRRGVDGVVAFLGGRYKQIERDLERSMHWHAGEQDYEAAALDRNRLQAVRALLERQRVANEGAGTYDAVAGGGEGSEANAQGSQARRAPPERQRVANEGAGTYDAVAVDVEGSEANAQVFQVRDGVLSDRQS